MQYHSWIFIRNVKSIKDESIKYNKELKVLRSRIIFKLLIIIISLEWAIAGMDSRMPWDASGIWFFNTNSMFNPKTMKIPCSQQIW